MIQVESATSNGYTVFTEITDIRIVAQASIYTYVVDTSQGQRLSEADIAKLIDDANGSKE